MPIKKKLIFEDCIVDINREIAKRRNKWSLTALSWMDFEDVSQIIRIHIHKKWDMYDVTKPLGPWVNRIISNQIKNLIRNNYGNFARPCLKCAAAEGADLCSIYEKQDTSCPLYKHWVLTKKNAHDAKLPLPLENHTQEVHSKPNDNIDIERAALRLHGEVEKILKPMELIAYKYLYVDHLDEEVVAKKMGYKTNEKNRSPGYKQIKNMKKSIISKVKKLLAKDDVDIFNG
jgi:hypothetical protein